MSSKHVCIIPVNLSQSTLTHVVKFIYSYKCLVIVPYICLLGVRGTTMRGAGVPISGELHGPVPVAPRHLATAAAIACCHRVALGLQVQTVSPALR